MDKEKTLGAEYNVSLEYYRHADENFWGQERFFMTLNAAILAAGGALVSTFKEGLVIVPFSIFGLLFSITWLFVGGRISEHVLSRQEQMAYIGRRMFNEAGLSDVMTCVERQYRDFPRDHPPKRGGFFARYRSSNVRRLVVPFSMIAVWIVTLILLGSLHA